MVYLVFPIEEWIPWLAIAGCFRASSELAIVGDLWHVRLFFEYSGGRVGPFHIRKLARPSAAEWARVVRSQPSSWAVRLLNKERFWGLMSATVWNRIREHWPCKRSIRYILMQTYEKMVDYENRLIGLIADDRLIGLKADRCNLKI